MSVIPTTVDVVTILWERTSLIPLTQQTIVQATVIGSLCSLR